MQERLNERTSRRITRDSMRIKTQCDLETCEDTIQTQRNVKFSDCLVSQEKIQRKHQSSSILKKRSLSNLGKMRVRSDSVNSMSGQSTRDDQACENAHINKTVKAEYDFLMRKFAKKGYFRDEIFPPILTSVFAFSGKKRKNQTTSIKWMRISELFGDRDLTVMGSDSSKTKIMGSSNLAAEYMIQAFNVIKNSKSQLKRMFQAQEINKQGVYYVKLFKANTFWTYILIDDFIPVVSVTEGKKEKIQPAFINVTHSLGVSKQPLQIWPFLLEKAFAKIYSNYEALQKGNIHDFLEEITNQPCEFYSLEDRDLNYREIFNGNPDTLAFAENRESKKTPVVCTVGQSRKVSFIKGEKQRVIIEPEELGKHFQSLYIHGWRRNTYYGQCPIKQSKESISLRTFSLKSAAFVSLTLYQKDEKYFHEASGYSYSWIRLVLLQKEIGEGFRWIDGRYESQKSLTIDSQLPAGEYYVLVMPEWQSRKIYELNLILRSRMPIRMERKSYQEGIFEEGCADLSQRFGRLNQLNQSICSYNCIHEDMGMIIENINNERLKGNVRILRSIEGLNSAVTIQVFNRQFCCDRRMEIMIGSESHYTVVLVMRGGIDHEFFQTFDFDGN